MIESRFHIGENENTTTEKRTPQKTANRRFGVKLSANIASNSKDGGSTPKKIVRVRRAVSSSKSKDRKTNSVSSSPSDEVVVFSPGPVGLQLEPNQEDPCTGCRIVRFVDGGPKNPGQARKSGKLKLGDLITQVEANAVVGSSYADIVEILKDSCATRRVSFRSVWTSAMLDYHSKSSRVNTSKPNKNLERPLTPNAHNLSAKRKISTPLGKSLKFETHLPPPLPGSNSNRQQKEELDHDSRFDITLIQSPSHAALLPHVRTPPSHAALWSHVQIPSSLPKTQRQQHPENQDGPTTVEMEDNFATQPLLPSITKGSVPRNSSRRNSNFLTPPNITGEGPAQNVSVFKMPPGWQQKKHRDANDPILSPCTAGSKETKILPQFSPSSVRRLSVAEISNGSAENTIMSRVFGRLCQSVPQMVANSSAIHNLWQDPSTDSIQKIASIQSIDLSSSEMEEMDGIKAKVLQELNCAKIAKDVEDIATQELEAILKEKNEEYHLLHVDFNEKLQSAKAQHANTEKELKEMYANKCRCQQSKILELESENLKLKERPHNSRGHLQLSTVQETLHRTMGKLESKRNEAEQLKHQNGQYQERIRSLQVELETLRTNEKGLLLELEMSRTMTKEMERRVLDVEALSEKSVEALEGDLLEKEEKLNTTQSLVSKLKEEGENMFAHMNTLDAGVKALQDEIEEIRWERDRAKTELAESKNEIATIHENLLHNLENGASCLHVDFVGGDTECSNLETSLTVTEKMKDMTARYRVSRCAMAVFMIREKNLEYRGAQHLEQLEQLDVFNQELLLALQKSQERVILKDAALENRTKQLLALRREMKTAIHSVTHSQNKDRDGHFKQLLKVGVCIDQQSVTTHHLVSIMRRNTEVLQVSLSKMEWNLAQCTSQLEQKIHPYQVDLQAARHSENELKTKLDVTMEKLARTSMKLRVAEQDKADMNASLQDSEEALSEAVEVIKKLEDDVATKDAKLASAEARINALKEIEDLVSSEHIGLCENILVLEERLTESTESICKLRRTCNSFESQNAALEAKLKTMTSVSEDMKKVVLEKEELQQKASILKDQLKICEAELSEAQANNSLLESDFIDLLNKSEKHRRQESPKLERTIQQLLIEVSSERDLRHALGDQFLETTQTLESMEQKNSELLVIFLAYVGMSDTKNQLLLHRNKALDAAIEEKTGDIRELEQEVSSSQGKIQKIQRESRSLEKDLIQLERTRTAEAHGLKREIETLECALDSSRTQHLATRASLQLAQDMLSNATSERDDLQSQILEAQNGEEDRRLRSTVRKAQFMYCASLAAMEGMKRLSSKTAEDVALKNTQIGLLADQMSKIEDELKCIEGNYELENCLLQENVHELRRTVCSQMAASISEYFRSRKDHARSDDTKTTISELQRQLDCTQSKLFLTEADLRRSFSAHKNENEGLKMKAQAFEDKIKDLEERLRFCREECDLKTREIHSLQSCIDEDEDKIFGNLETFEGEKERLSATIFELAEDVLMLKGAFENLQEDHINEIEDTTILLENLRREKVSILTTLAEAKKEAHNETQRNKVQLDSLKRTFEKLNSEKLTDEGCIRILENRVEDLVAETKMHQRESNGWRSKAESLNSKLQAISKKYSESEAEITSLYQMNKSLRKHLNRSEEMVLSLNKQQKVQESELKSKAIVITKVEEEKENALWELNEAKIQLEATDTELRQKVEMLEMEKNRLWNDRCIAEAAMVGLRRQSVTNRQIFSWKDKDAPSIAIGVEGSYTPSWTNSIERTKPEEQELRSQKQTAPPNLDFKNGDSSCAGIAPSRDAPCDEGTLHNNELLLARALETSSKPPLNLKGNKRMMGARLLSRVVEQKTRMGVAGAFRKWSCANNAMKATSQLHKTSKELSQQLHCTREKLLVLKSHIKSASIQQKDSEPRLRKVLIPLTDRQRLTYHGETMKL
ncbi:unnamed protein product [Cylindrotheca closterium]|uniref:PDZ domain-containing protein n=1 Tax=Cylindrotheca closterium TaxID=2856 RepID=A0AAD2CKI2_9STRA|nr:unnamed protein product [Cylindrotheca closterium]